jgi:hypothetical protein
VNELASPKALLDRVLTISNRMKVKSKGLFYGLMRAEMNLQPLQFLRGISFGHETACEVSKRVYGPCKI